MDLWNFLHWHISGGVIQHCIRRRWLTGWIVCGHKINEIATTEGASFDEIFNTQQFGLGSLRQPTLQRWPIEVVLEPLGKFVGDVQSHNCVRWRRSLRQPQTTVHLKPHLHRLGNFWFLQYATSVPGEKVRSTRGLAANARRRDLLSCISITACLAAERIA